MTARVALSLVVTLAGVTVLHHHHKRPGASSATTGIGLPRTVLVREPKLPGRPAPVRASRQHTRPVLRLVQGDGLDWPALAECESTDNPRAVDPSGTYFGLYQFDILTWRSVGGRGNPADATRAEQTLRARILYGQRGRTPWPVCGVNL